MVRDKITHRVYYVFLPTDNNIQKTKNRVIFLKDAESGLVIHLSEADYYGERYEMLDPSGSIRHA